MSRVALDLGIVQIYWYSLCILVGMMIGMFLVYKETRKKRINDVLITNLIFYTIVVAIIGARLYYVAFDWGYYSKNPLEILEIWNGGLAIHGAIILGGLFLITYTKQHKMDTLKVLDICSVGLIIGQAIGRWGNFFNQEVFGSEVSLKFLQGLHLPNFIIEGMHIGGKYYHPLFLYESLWCLLGFIILLIVRRRKYIKTGQIFGLYCMWYSLERFFLEGMRDEKYNLMLGNFKVAQIISIGMFVVGLFFFVRRFKTSRFEYLYNDEDLHVESTIRQNEELNKKKNKTAFFTGNNNTQQSNSFEPPPVQEQVVNTQPAVETQPVVETQPAPIKEEVKSDPISDLLNAQTNAQPVINQEMQNQTVTSQDPVPMIVNNNQMIQPQPNQMVEQIPQTVEQIPAPVEQVPQTVEQIPQTVGQAPIVAEPVPMAPPVVPNQSTMYESPIPNQNSQPINMVNQNIPSVPAVPNQPSVSGIPIQNSEQQASPFPAENTPKKNKFIN